MRLRRLLRPEVGDPVWVTLQRAGRRVLAPGRVVTAGDWPTWRFASLAAPNELEPQGRLHLAPNVHVRVYNRRTSIDLSELNPLIPES